jgi:hypothetical protein
MSNTVKPVYEATFEEGTKVRIEGADIPKPQLVEGELPSTQQMDAALMRGKETLRETAKEAELDSKGKQLEKDLEGIIDSTSRLIVEKNKGEKLQKFVKETKEAVEDSKEALRVLPQRAREKMEEENIPESERLRLEASQLYGYMKDLSLSFIKSPDFREVLSDWVQFFQSLTVENIKEVAVKKGDTQIGQAIAEGLQQPEKPPKDEIQRKTEERLRELLIKLSSNPVYQNMTRDILKLADALRWSLEDASENPPVELKHFRNAYNNALNFIAEFTGKKDLDEFRRLCWEAYLSVREDQRLVDWFVDFRNLLERILKEPEIATGPETKKEIEELIERGRDILQDEKWKKIFSVLRDQFQVLLENVKSDTATMEFQAKLEKFAKDLILNERGNPDLYVLEDSLSQLRNLVLPLFKHALENIPIKKIEIISDTYDVKIEDLVFDATTFMPEHLDFRMLNVSHVDFKHSERDVLRHQLFIQVDHIKPQFKHLKFYYRRKTFPTIEDYGVADVGLTGEGAMIRVLWTIESRGGRRPVAELSEVKCQIDKITIHIVGEATKHNILDAIMAPLMSSVIKNKMSELIEDYLRAKLNNVTDSINEFFASRPTERLKERAEEMIQSSIEQMTFGPK